MAAGLDPEDMKIVRLQDEQLNMAVEIPVIPGLFAAMGDGQGLRSTTRCTHDLSWTVNYGSCTPKFRRFSWSMPTTTSG